MMTYGKIRESEDEFEKASRHQASPTLAASGGQISPIARHSTGNPDLEKAAFSLHPGELSQLIHTPEGFVVLKCVKRIPAQTGKRYEEVRPELNKLVFEKKLRLEIPNAFKELKDQAEPNLIFKDAMTDEDRMHDVQRDLKPEQPKTGTSAPPGK